MRAAKFQGKNKISVEEMETPKITKNEILVRVSVSAVCGTDVRIFLGNKTKGVRVPSIIGHETTGVIEEIGDCIDEYNVGERVGVIPVIPCRKCYYCLNAMENACLNRVAIGYEFDGGFAEYLKVPKEAVEAGNLVKLPDKVSNEQAVVTEPLACCFNGHRKSNIKVNDTVVVVGGGPIGLMHVQLAKIAGAKKVIVSELVSHRREKALIAGADLAINPDEESLNEVVLKETEHLGADAVVMAIGVPAIVNESISLLRKGGTINLFAGFTKGVTSDIDPNFIHYNEVNIVGTSALKRSDYLNALALIESGQINTEVLTSKGYSLDDIEKAILDVKNGIGMKSLIHI
ncbi:zinc-binding dehydrogenase [Tuberibacillus sp. Marseille-P3662]|uniref:zinc-binding dehydrogenase n=1 Tax=Tuberibacillus sp. Marseille-P3662 TaxID=1965358 RepID=UPI000A1CA2F0|nr:alcohol dehydrogenase catalytic domain-containing protein [Tuberibacillus sp. Marseille-P3662]